MTTQAAYNNSNLQAAWSAHKRGSSPKVVASRFDADCVISYVPAGGIYRGHREIESLLGQQRAAHFCFDTPEVLSTVFADNTVIEESLVTIRHEQSIDYLLPGVKATDRELTCAMFTVSTFRGDKMLSQRVYWDHASMLRQAGLLPQSVRGRNGSEVALKVAGNDVAKVVKAAFVPTTGGDALQDSSKTASQTTAAAAQSSETRAPLLPDDVEQPRNATAAVSEVEAQPVTKPAAQPATPDPYGGAEVNVANRANPVTGGRQSVRLYAPPGGVSQINLGQTANFNTSPNSFESPSRHRNVPRTPSQSDAFESSSSDSATTRGVHAARNRGSIGFGSESPEPAAPLVRSAAAPPAAVGEPQQQQQQSGAPPVTGSRVSVRLFAPPGGNSQITFG
ncbi:hypothetical protein HDU86_005919 [Geranomyces michiganensis]|nr:hypothetical protein HDU86_005919 [Geranomyces michiganensis]